jgi:mannosylglycerate hydrolase
MKPDSSHIKQIKVVSNTHWDREFRRSFEKTRRRLLTMLDTALEILERDPAYHSYTLDGHSILMEDYLEMRPEKRPLVERLVRAGRLVLGPYYTLPEEFSVSQEALVRNLLWGRKTVEGYGGKTGTVAYTPSSWGQTGQLPQILTNFGLSRMMFYRGISHHESDAEFLWSSPDGSTVLASRFALYARYNWYYLVHRAVTSGKTFDKTYTWGERDESPFRFADGLHGEDPAFDLKSPAIDYDSRRLAEAIEEMVRIEGPHFTTEVFLAMNGHDISAPYPLETRIIADAQRLLGHCYAIEHTDLESYWQEVEKHVERDALPRLTGERRSYLRQGMWTFLFPGTISARTYLKQQDFRVSNLLVGDAEPLACLASSLGQLFPSRHLDRAWRYLLSNHTHDANGGCAPDQVCLDMEYRYRKVADLADIVIEDAMSHVTSHLSPSGQQPDAVQLVIFNPLERPRDEVMLLDLELPFNFPAGSVSLRSDADPDVEIQPVSSEKSSSFVDSIWDVPRVLSTRRLHFHARLRNLPALGYRSYQVILREEEPRNPATLITGPNTMENAALKVRVNYNGSVDLFCKRAGRTYSGLNYLTDQGECGNAWRHLPPRSDAVYTSLGARARIAVAESGPLAAAIYAEYEFQVPADCPDGRLRSETLVSLPIRTEYRLEGDSPLLLIKTIVDNRARDHWLRANFPSGLQAEVSWADTHFDVVSRPVALPDATGWAEPAGGTHPLQSFAAVSDGKNVLAVLPRGLFEYEVFQDAETTLALTLIRACRIRLAVSEEKQTELPDQGIQCPGIQRFEYALVTGTGSWSAAELSALARRRASPLRAAVCGRGKGRLPMESSLFCLQGDEVLRLSCVKLAEDGVGFIIRVFNPALTAADGSLEFRRNIRAAHSCRMDEAILEQIPVFARSLSFTLEAKKIATFRIALEE